MGLSTTVRLVAASLLMALSLDSMAITAAGKNSEKECMLEPSADIEISAAVEGVLDTVLVQRGDVVKRGQILAKLTSGIERAAVAAAQARVEFAKRKSVRNQELYEKKLVSIHDKDEMDTELLIARLQLKQAEEQLELRSISSPVDGLVVERERDRGEYVDTAPLLKIVSLDPLHVEVVVLAENFGVIKEGMTGEVRTVGPVVGTYQAKVILVDKVIDAASGTIRVRLALANPDSAIPAGLKCYVKFLPE